MISFFEANIICKPRRPADGPTGSLLLQSGPAQTEWVKAPPGLTKPNEWFTLEVIARGDHVITRVEGTTTAEKRGVAGRPRGHLILQQYGAETAVEFRKIEIKELPPTTATAPPLAVAPFGAEQARLHQEAWARHLGVEPEMVNSIGMKLRLIPPGSFVMGTSEEDVRWLSLGGGEWTKTMVQSEGPQRKVTIAEPFYLGSREVTVGQFKQFVRATNYKTRAETSDKGGRRPISGLQLEFGKEYTWLHPADAPSDDHPVVQVSLPDVRAFCDWLSKTEGRTYAAVNEEQWEYACRAGTTTQWYNGDTEDGVGAIAWYYLNAKDQTHPVGGKQPNAFGLYDMLGNVEELCSTPEGRVVLRGGGVRSLAVFARSATRLPVSIDFHYRIGFRVALVGDLKATARPFVIQGKGGRAETRHPTLAAAVQAAQSGDTIEVRGDGPFLCAGVATGKKALAIRAAAGSHPVLRADNARPGPHGALISAESALILEGLELQRVGEPHGEKHGGYDSFVRCDKGAPLMIANCRLAIRTENLSTATVARESLQMELRNSQITGNVTNALDWFPAPDGRLVVENCLLSARDHAVAIRWSDGGSEGASAVLNRNTITGPHVKLRRVMPFSLAVYPEAFDRLLPRLEQKDKAALPKPIRARSVGNLFDSNHALILTLRCDQKRLSLEQQKDYLAKLLSWEEEANGYRPRIHFGVLFHQYRQTPGASNTLFGEFQSWKDFWRLETSCQQGVPQFQGRDVERQFLTAPESVLPEDLRLQPDSFGHRSGPSGKDLGADVDLVGPGAAYERWKKTSEYAQWLKKTQELLTKAAQGVNP